MERRFVLPANVELRSEDREGKPVLTGYAARFESLSVPMDDGDGEYRERLRPGAFTRTLQSGLDVVALGHHDSKLVLGRQSAGTLKLVEDERGLRVEIIPPDTTTGRDIAELVRRGDLDSMSFGFAVVDEEYRNEGGEVVREVRDVDLYEVSVVTWPAYPATEISVRADVPGKVRAMRRSVPMARYRAIQRHAETR